jgi:hypothetical protein
MTWLAESDVLDKTDKVTVTITKEDISVEYDPPIPDGETEPA